MAQPFKLLPAMLASDMKVNVSPGYSTSHQLLATAPRKAAADDPNSWAPATHVGG